MKTIFPHADELPSSNLEALRAPELLTARVAIG